MIDFSTLKGLTIPEGVVTQITDASGVVLWALSGGKVILEVEKITSDTYAGETTYTGEQFILLDIYPKTNGTVKVTYGGLTKTITDTSGAEEPNAQQVFFGTFNGVSDSVATPASGELTIEGDYYSFAQSEYIKSSGKTLGIVCVCIKNIISLGKITKIVGRIGTTSNMTVELVIPKSVTYIAPGSLTSMPKLTTIIIEGCPEIGYLSMDSNTSMKVVKVLSTIPPNVVASTNGVTNIFGNPTSSSFAVEQIVVPKGCSNAYKAATGWSEYADIIEEAS